MYEKINGRKWVPMVWFNQRVALTEDLAPLVGLIVMAPQLGAGIFFGLAAVGTLMMVAELMLRLRPAWRDPEENEPLLSAEDDPAAAAYARSPRPSIIPRASHLPRHSTNTISVYPRLE
ncbi:Protein croquemort [Gryllus bimaculatus]|nr:Protein croquemort [Gryllus bimaculatus]